MPIVLTCPHCGARMAAPDGAAGRNGKCPHCQRIIRIQPDPAPETTVPPPTSAPPPPLAPVAPPKPAAAPRTTGPRIAASGSAALRRPPVPTSPPAAPVPAPAPPPLTGEAPPRPETVQTETGPVRPPAAQEARLPLDELAIEAGRIEAAPGRAAPPPAAPRAAQEEDPLALEEPDAPPEAGGITPPFGVPAVPTAAPLTAPLARGSGPSSTDDTLLFEQTPHDALPPVESRPLAETARQEAPSSRPQPRRSSRVLLVLLAVFALAGLAFAAVAAVAYWRGSAIASHEDAALAACHQYCVAQEAFHKKDWDTDRVLEYAQHLNGKNSLYLDPEGKETGLLSKDFAEAEGEPGQAAQPLHGYCFKVLTEQGGNAEGGQMSYFAYPSRTRTYMTRGYALVAYPAEYGSTGRRTFIVNHKNKVYARDLGETTGASVANMRQFDPDSSWETVP